MDTPKLAELDPVLRAALEAASLAVVVVDHSDRIVFYNPAAERLWGYTPAQVLGREFTLLLPACLDDAHGGSLRANRGGHGVHSGGAMRELVLRRADGGQVSTTFSLSHVALGGRRHHVVFLRDNSDEVRQREEHRLLLLAVNRTDRAMLVLDQAYRIVRVNPAFTALFGHEAHEVQGRFAMQALVSPRIDPTLRKRVRQRGRENLAFREEVLGMRKDGRDLWLRMTVNPVSDDGGAQCNMVVTFDDITEQRLIQDLHHEALEALMSALSFEQFGEYLCRRVAGIAPDVVPSIVLVDAEGRMRSWAVSGLPPAYNAMIDGLPAGDGMGSCGTAAARGERVLSADIRDDPAWAPYRALLLQNGLHACWSYPIKRRQGSVAGTFAFYKHEPSLPQAFHERIIDACVHLCALAIEREENRQQLARLVQFDTLTGLPNRSHLQRHVDELLARAQAGTQIAVFCLGMDRFKDVNSALGHAAGDEVLVAMGNRLRALLEHEQYLSRPEGDSFFIVAPGCDVAGASLLAERAERALAESICVAGHELRLSASVGISLFPEGGSTRDTLLVNARHAMYRAKAAGGGVYAFFDTDMNLFARERLLLGAALRRAVAEGGLRLAYQPQLREDTGELYGVEALARWHDPAFGEVPPGRFIGLAEDISVIDEIGRWALREACAQLAAWRAQGLVIPAVSVNLSPLSFRGPGLPAHIAALLEESGLSGASLTIEITESAMMTLTPEMLASVHAIRELGVGLSVDDFGTGFSSLSNLVNLPVTEIKIDRSFIGKCLEQSRLLALVSAVVGLGRSLQLDVVAEGVETREQAQLLRDYGCPVLQGYLFARPMPADELPLWLARRGLDSAPRAKPGRPWALRGGGA